MQPHVKERGGGGGADPRKSEVSGGTNAKPISHIVSCRSGAEGPEGASVVPGGSFDGRRRSQKVRV